MHAGGRPALWKNPKNLQVLIQSYYDTCRDESRPLTIAGLAVWLDCDRQTVYNYAEKDEFFDTLKKARDYILASLEEKMMAEGKAGQIFLAKNYGYRDTQGIEMSGSVNNPFEGLTTDELRKMLDDNRSDKKTSKD